MACEIVSKVLGSASIVSFSSRPVHIQPTHRFYQSNHLAKRKPLRYSFIFSFLIEKLALNNFESKSGETVLSFVIFFEVAAAESIIH